MGQCLQQEDVCYRRVGSSRHNEGFTDDYDLPNKDAYAETCAAIGLIFAQRMLHVDADARYADIMERALYNGALSGISLMARSSSTTIL